MAAQAQDCAPDRVHVRGTDGVVTFSVELVDTYAERAQGLMHRTFMADNAGMLFLYDRPQRLSFWMRNTLIELDMIFIRPDGVVAHIHERAQPLDETPVHGGPGLNAVLEINGGLSAALGIEVGAALRHPFFGPDAAWPC